MINNLTFAVTGNCNSRCSMCNQWQSNAAGDIKPEECDALFAKPEFKDIEYLNLTGGEPFLRTDIKTLTRAILQRLKNVSTLFVSTNGTMPKKTTEFAKVLIRQYEDLDVSITVSIDGDRDINKKIRGVDSYEAAIKTLKLCREISKKIKTMISATLTTVNCSDANLRYLKKLADETGSDFSFRLAAKNNFYANPGLNLDFSKRQLSEVIDFSRRFCAHNPFLMAQADFLETGELSLIKDVDRLRCKAGQTFIFIDSRGDIFPCINSTRKIGDKKSGITSPIINDLGAHEQCVCCTECTFYPMYYDKER